MPRSSSRSRSRSSSRSVDSDYDGAEGRRRAGAGGRRRADLESSSGSEDRAPSEVPEAATEAAQDEADSLGFNLSDVEEGEIRTVADRPVKLRLNDSLLDAYHSKILGAGYLERRMRRDLQSKYWLSQAQSARMAPPSLRGSKICHLVKSVEDSGAGRQAMEAHEYLRYAVRTELRLHEAVSCLGRELRGFGVTQLFGDDGAPVAGLQFMKSDAFIIDEADQAEEARLGRVIAADVGKAARTILRMKKASRENESRLGRAIGMISAAEALAAKSKTFVNMAATLSWDSLQLLG